MCPHYLLVDADTGATIVPKLQLATTFWRRLRGLQFRRSLPPDQGLLLGPCASIHTHWMRFSIDVAMLDGRGVVLAIHLDVRPWRMLVGPRETKAILETPGNSLLLRVGQRVVLRRSDNSEWQASPLFSA